VAQDVVVAWKVFHQTLPLEKDFSSNLIDAQGCHLYLFIFMLFPLGPYTTL